VAKLRERGVETLAELITKEMGKVISEARREVEGAVNKDDILKLMRAANEVMCVCVCM
jgi:acyl-CoA reductase-like NAD-dependent aldehyde dehydrogenase